MAMAKCRECDAEVSSEAKVCPKCGISKPVKKTSILVKLIVGFMGFIFLSSIMSTIANKDTQVNQIDKMVGWRTVGQISDSFKFIEIALGKEKDRATYDNAVNILCKNKGDCSIAFFLSGDRIPATQSFKQFFDNGQFRDYPLLAFWANSLSSGSANFTTWDCERAGADGAPLDALCGVGIREANSAILKIAGRTGMAEACLWPLGNGPDVAASYIASISDPGRREQFQSNYNRSYSSSRTGPDNREDCKNLRPKIEEATKLAIKTLTLPRN